MRVTVFTCHDHPRRYIKHFGKHVRNTEKSVPVEMYDYVAQL